MLRLIFAALLLIGCTSGSGSVGYYGTASATVVAPGPDLVYVSPGVQVIADYHEPVFYTDGYYWRYYGGVWYRSHSYRGGWAWASPPRTLLRIERPYAYVRYRPRGYVSRRPVYRDDRPVIRDQRRDRYRDTRPEVRDHRTRPVPERRVDRRDDRGWRERVRDQRDDRGWRERVRDQRGDRGERRERAERRDQRGDRGERRERAERRDRRDGRGRPVIRDRRR